MDRFDAASIRRARTDERRLWDLLEGILGGQAVLAAHEKSVQDLQAQCLQVNGEIDELIDALYLKIFNDMVLLMMEDSRNIRRATATMFAAKHLERFGDHATNLAEMVVYMVRGTDIRHPRSRVREEGET